MTDATYTQTNSIIDACLAELSAAQKQARLYRTLLQSAIAALGIISALAVIGWLR